MDPQGDRRGFRECWGCLRLFQGFRGFFVQAQVKVQLGFDIRALGVVCYGGCVSGVCERAAKLLEKDSVAVSLRSCC